ncbi:collagenase family protein, partial [Vibrio parahaemolyticus V-223/04]
QRFGVIANLHL